MRAAINRAHPVLLLLVIVAGQTPLAAFHVPQSRQEFVEAVAAGEGATKMETLIVEQDLDEVYGMLEGKSTSCLAVAVKRSGFVGGQMEVSSSEYRPTLTRVDRHKAEFSLQVVHRPRPLGAPPPPGGIYLMAANLRSIGKGRTEVVLYRPTIGFKKIVESFKQWSSGEDANCPKMR